MAEGPVQKAAENAVFKLTARSAMIIIAAVGLPLAGVVGKRIIDNLDKISDKQDNLRDEMYRINQLIVGIQGDNRVLNGRIDGINRDFTSRMDSISAWTRRNSDEIDKVKDWFLKPKQ